MSLQDLGALGEFLGFFAVVVTLIYLAYQTRQNTQAIRAQIDAARLATQVQIELRAGSDNVTDAFYENEASRKQFKRSAWLRMVFFTWHWWFLQTKTGVLPTSDFDREFRSLSVLFAYTPGLDELWEQISPSYTPDFVEAVEEVRSLPRLPSPYSEA